jgi:hypothetical protein
MTIIEAIINCYPVVIQENWNGHLRDNGVNGLCIYLQVILSFIIYYFKIMEKPTNRWTAHKNHFKIGNEDVQPYLLGDSAYSLQIGLMKCFGSKATDTPQQNIW